MIVEYLRYTIPEGDRAAFIAAYEAAKSPLLASPHALGFEMAQCVEDPGEFILRIEWTSAEDHLQRFRGSAEFKDFFGHIRAYVGAITEMRHYQVRSSG